MDAGCAFPARLITLGLYFTEIGDAQTVGSSFDRGIDGLKVLCSRQRSIWPLRRRQRRDTRMKKKHLMERRPGWRWGGLGGKLLGIPVFLLAFTHPLWCGSPPPVVSNPVAGYSAASDPSASPAPPLPNAPPADVKAQIKELLAQKQFAAAEKMIIQQLTLTPKDPDLLTRLAELRMDQGRDGEAVKLLVEANHSGGETAYRDMLIGVAESLWNREDLADPEFRAAINLDPFNPVAHFFLARLLYNKKRYDEAIQESKNAIGLAPSFVRAYENLGLCYEETDRLKEAEQAYREAIRLDADHARKTEWPVLDLGKMLFREGRLEESKLYLEQALAINPENPKTLETMGLLKEKLGDESGALDDYRAAIKADPTEETPYYRAAMLCKRLGQAAQSAQYLDKFMQLRKANATPHIDAKPPTFPQP
jgi:tetratricopeptide (TPR) repeat protein